MVYLSYMEVFRFLKATPSSRNVFEVQEVLNAEHLIRVGLKQKQKEVLEIYGRSTS